MMKRLLNLLFLCALTCGMSAQSADNYRGCLVDAHVKIDHSNLPIIFIDVDGQTIQRDSYVLARMKILHNGDGQVNYGDTLAHPGQHIDYEGYIALRYRGNSSFNSSDKKPMLFRTLATKLLPDDGGAKQKVKLLGMNKDNKWCFIAPWADETMFRDVLSFELGKPWFDWVPDTRMCEVVLDGTYYGLYVLTERVSKGKHRLDLNDPGSDGNDFSGDYHVVVDHGYDPYYPSKYYPWQSLDGSRQATRFRIKYEYSDPDADEFSTLPLQAKGALHRAIDDMESSFLSDNWQDPVKGYRSFIDVTSFIDYMLSTEVSMNIDGYRLSTHLYKRSDYRGMVEGIDSRWKTTLWDFNIAWGNADYNNGQRTDTWQYLLNIINPSDDCPVPFYWYRMLQDSAYTDALKQRWKDYRRSNYATNRLMSTVDSLVHLVKDGGAVERNEQAWGIFDKGYIWPIPYYAPNYDDAVVYLKNWIQQRLLFLDKHLLPPRHLQTVPVEVLEGWNADIVAESFPVSSTTTITIDGSDRALYSSLLRSSGGLPANGAVVSGHESINYQLQPATADNALALHAEGQSGTLVFSQPVQTDEIFVLGTSGNGNSHLLVTLNYVDGESVSAGIYEIRDWSVRDESLRGDEAVTHLGNIRRIDNVYSSDNHYCLFDFSVPVDESRPLESVTFESKTDAYASVMALSQSVIQEQAPEVPSAIDIAAQSRCKPVGVYSMGGSRLSSSHSGLNVLRYSDGTVRKVFVRK